MEKIPDNVSIDDVEQRFRQKFNEFVHEYCSSSQNSFTVDREKRTRILRCLKDAKDEPSARFRFWVRTKGFRIVVSPEGEDILALPPKSNDPNETLFRRIACTDEFFDIIHAAHSENGHVGQSMTYRAISGIYALVPRIMVIKFIRLCPQCSNTFLYSCKKKGQHVVPGNTISMDKLAGTHNSFAVVKQEPGDIQNDAFDDTEDAVQNQQDVDNALNDLLSGKMNGAEIRCESDDIAGISVVSGEAVVFPCHLCKEVFTKSKALQKHITAHQNFKPSVPLPKMSPHSKKRKVNVAAHSMSLPRPKSRRKAGVSRKRVIIDVDSSPTAAQAIVLAASRPDIELVAINCVAGRVSVLHACENALRILKVCGREDVHVCRGAEKSLLGFQSCEENLPGVAWTRKVEGQVQAEHSVSSLIRCVNENPGEITLICLGPLTNLALALRLDAFVASNLKEVFVVGGNIEAQGDLCLCAEQNFFFDPEAAHIVLKEMKDVCILPLEVGQRHCIPFKHFITCLNTGTEIANFLIESVNQEELQQQAKIGVISPELFTVAMAIDSSIILEKENIAATIELKGEYSRGLMVVDRRGFLNKSPNCYIVKNMDVGKIQALFGSVFAIPELQEQLTPIMIATGTSHVPVILNKTRVGVIL